MKQHRQFVAFFWFVRWDCISLGLHLCVTGPHIEIHVPFGFFKIGWVQTDAIKSMNHGDIEWRRFGLGVRYKDNPMGFRALNDS